MAWIKSHQELLNHPKTLDLMRIMGWDVDVCLSKLHRFWWWCLDYAEDGDLRKHNDDRLGRAVGLNGGEDAKRFVNGLVDVGWLDREPYFRVHDWWDHIGRFLKIKYSKNPSKWQIIEKSYKEYSSSTPAVLQEYTDKIRLDKKREDKKRKEKDKKLVACATFIQPKIEEVRNFIVENNYKVNADQWLSHYESNGWKVGRTQMKDWKAAIRKWHYSSYGGTNANKISGGLNQRPNSSAPSEDGSKFAGIGKVIEV